MKGELSLAGNLFIVDPFLSLCVIFLPMFISLSLILLESILSPYPEEDGLNVLRCINTVLHAV